MSKWKLTKPARVVGSDEQAEIWSVLMKTKEHLFVEAGPGVGKTFTIVEGCKRYADRFPEQDVVNVAFNVSIANTLKERLGNDLAATWHSLGNRILLRNFGKLENLKHNKVEGLVRLARKLPQVVLGIGSLAGQYYATDSIYHPQAFREECRGEWSLGWTGTRREDWDEWVQVTKLVNKMKGYWFEGALEDTLVEVVERYSPEVLMYSEERQRGVYYKVSAILYASLGMLVWSQEKYKHIFESTIGSANSVVGGYPSGGDAVQVAKIMEVSSTLSSDTSYIDFGDMIWGPTFLQEELELPKYDVMFLDEAQDLDAIQRELAVLLAKRLVVVGDSFQAIYGFRGASYGSMATLAENVGGDVTWLPLLTSRRLPQVVTRLAQKINPKVKCLPDAPEGKILEMDLLGVEDRLRKEKRGMVLCRINAPLVSMYFYLSKHKIKSRIQGRDIGEALIETVRGLKAKSVVELIRAVGEYRITGAMKLKAAKKTSQLEMLNDSCECLLAIAEEVDTMEDFYETIKEVFRDEKQPGQEPDRIILSSVHRAKGLEHDTVYIIRTDKMPHSMAKVQWELEEEYHIIFVAITRTSHTLICSPGVPNLSGWGAVKAGSTRVLEGDTQGVKEAMGPIAVCEGGWGGKEEVPFTVTVEPPKVGKKPGKGAKSGKAAKKAKPKR
jgi:superfamily I DNA/RNA helicase